MKSGKLSRLLMFALVLALAVSSFSMVAFAESAVDPDETTIVETTDEDNETEEPQEPEETKKEEPEEEAPPVIEIPLTIPEGNELVGTLDVLAGGAAATGVNPTAAVITPPSDAGHIIASVKDGNNNNIRYQQLKEDEAVPPYHVIAVYPVVLEDDYSPEIDITFKSAPVIKDPVIGVDQEVNGNVLSVDLSDVDWTEIDHSDVFFTVTVGGTDYFVTFYATAGLDIYRTHGGTLKINGKPGPVANPASIYLDPGLEIEFEAVPINGYQLADLVLFDSDEYISDLQPTKVDDNKYTLTLESREYSLVAVFEPIILDDSDVVDSITYGGEGSLRRQILGDGTFAVYPIADENDLDEVTIALAGDLKFTAVNDATYFGQASWLKNFSANDDTLVVDLSSVNWTTVQHNTVFYQITLSDGSVYNLTFYATAGIKINIGTGGIVEIDGSIFTSSTDIYIDPADDVFMAGMYNDGYAFSSMVLSDSNGPVDLKPTQYINAFTYDFESKEYTLDVTFTSTNTSTGPGYTTGGGNGGSSGGGGGRTPNFGVGTTTTTTTTAAPVTQADANTATTTAINAAATAGSTTATVKFTNAGDIPAAVIASVAQQAEAAGVAAVIQADSLVNNAVDVRISFNAAGVTSGLNLSGSTVSAEANRVKALFSTYFTNKVAVVELGQAGAFGTPVRIAAKVDLTGINLEDIVLYTYNKTTNTYNRIAEPDLRVDANGYLWFTTTQGGAIIVSNGAFTK